MGRDREHQREEDQCDCLQADPLKLAQEKNNQRNTAQQEKSHEMLLRDNRQKRQAIPAAEKPNQLLDKARVLALLAGVGAKETEDLSVSLNVERQITQRDR